MAIAKELKDVTKVAVPSAYKTVSEVVAKLLDPEYAAQYVVKVNKGSASNPRFLDIIEWHTAIRMLTDVFGPFGFDLRIVGSTNDFQYGAFTTDMELTGRALDDVTGEVVSLTRPGRGLGLVPRSVMADERRTDAEYDRQIHGSKSDAITNATKGLGDGFGLYLYRKSSNGQSMAASGSSTTSSTTTAPRTSTAPAAGGSAGGGDLGARPSPGQMRVLEKAGYPASFVATLPFTDWKEIVNALLNKDEDGAYAPLTPHIAPPAKAAMSSNGRAPVAAGAPEPDDIPF